MQLMDSRFPSSLSFIFTIFSSFTFYLYLPLQLWQTMTMVDLSTNGNNTETVGNIDTVIASCKREAESDFEILRFILFFDSKILHFFKPVNWPVSQDFNRCNWFCTGPTVHRFFSCFRTELRAGWTNRFGPVLITMFFRVL